MGLDATITVVPRSEVRKKQRAAKLRKFELYREWHELDCALEKIGGPARLALRDNTPTPEDELDDCELFLVPPALVKKISKALDTVPGTKLLEIIHEQRRKSG